MKQVLFLLFVVFAAPMGAQVNLVPNYSFEIYDTCPISADVIHYAQGWNKYSTTASTPDYYNTCSPDSLFGIPESPFNNQNERRGCNAYAALITWGAAGNDREHIGIQLSQPLTIGQKYYMSFYTTLTESYYGGTYYGMPSNNIGLRFSTVAYNPNLPAPIDNFAHLNSSVVIIDSVNWFRISGSLIADSAYEYVVVGNFFDDSNTVIAPYICGNCYNVQSYYLVDDICVSTDSTLCNGGIDLLPCTNTIEEIGRTESVNIFPNPFNNVLNISDENVIYSFTMTDLLGNEIASVKDINQSSMVVDLSALPSGVYTVHFYYQNENLSVTKKIIKL